MKTLDSVFTGMTTKLHFTLADESRRGTEEEGADVGVDRCNDFSGAWQADAVWL